MITWCPTTLGDSKDRTNTMCSGCFSLSTQLQEGKTARLFWGAGGNVDETGGWRLVGTPGFACHCLCRSRWPCSLDKRKNGVGSLVAESSGRER